MIFINLAICALGIFTLVGIAKFFMKGGEEGWKCIIPIYNIYVWFKLVWKKKWFFVVMVILIGIYICTAILIIYLIQSMTVYLLSDTLPVISDSTRAIQGINLCTLIGLLTINKVFDVIAAVKTAEKLNASKVLLFILQLFVPPVFWIYVGFSDKQFNTENS